VHGTIAVQGDHGIPQTLELAFGGLDPITELSGIRARLQHLGYLRGPVDGASDAGTERALRAFQEAQGLEVTGVVDDATRDRLREAHGI
jgi:N-acetylmuramoyl-L-alanine amidase